MKLNAYSARVSYSKCQIFINVSDEYIASAFKTKLLNIYFLRTRIGEFILIHILLC
jgi:hypothetical protein